jgi:hypothetical protein
LGTTGPSVAEFDQELTVVKASRTLIDRFNARIKNNPIVAALIILGTIVIALSTFTNAAKSLLALFMPDARPHINGEWKAEVTYDWRNASYPEIFTFSGDGEDVQGTASYLGHPRRITEGKARVSNLQFVTTTEVLLGADRKTARVEVHHYQGTVSRDEIKFVMQTEGGFTEHTPIAFTAKRVPTTSPPPTR